MQIVAEVKTISPFGFKSEKTWDELFEIANTVGDVISIHTDPRWGGSLELIKKARGLTKKPILAKGIHSKDSEITKAFNAGADWVLVVGRRPKKHLRKCWIEPISLDELKKLPKSTKVVWNSRDLETGGLKHETFEQARGVYKGWLCQASNITTVKDVNPAADAILIGGHLPQFFKELQVIYRQKQSKNKHID